MGVEELIPTISPFVYFVVDRLKVQLPQRAQRWLPELSASLGLVTILVALYATGPYSDEEWLSYAIQGIFLGLGATGLHQWKKTKEV